MYKVIIVDDELAARNGFSMYIKTMKSDFKVVECFEDGKEAIEYLKNNDVDVVITDIRMMEISGIEIAKFIYENKPDIKVVMVSAYKDFEYAYSAVEYKVRKILLKPVSFKDFSQALLKIGEELGDRAQNNRGYIIEKTGGNISKEILNRISPNAMCVTIGFRTEDYYEIIESKWSYGRDGFYRLINNFLNDCFKEMIEFYILDADDYMVRYLACSETFTDMESFEKELEIGAQKIKEMLEEDCGRYDESEKALEQSGADAFTGSAVIDRTKEYVEKHYSEDVSLYDLAAYFNVNSAYLSRLFKQRVGMGFSDYLTDTRIKNAKKYILEGKYKVEDVAKMVGYPNASYFSKVFKNCTGYTPRAFYLQEVMKKDEE